MSSWSKWVRSVGYAEGVSFLLLLGVAMPLKYLAGRPEAVTVVGAAHGGLWVAYLAVLGQAWMVDRWPFSRLFAGVVASVLPFGPFVFERRLARTAPEAA